MIEPLISVIVPVYKVEQYLIECVTSILNQTYQNLEILLIDDGSPDNCPQMCDKFATMDSRIRVIHKTNGGLADARNTGLENATGEYVAFVDSDDWIDLNTYTEMMRVFLDNQNIDIVCCSASRVLKNEVVDECFSYYDSGTIKSGAEITKRILLDEIGSQVVKGLYKYKCWEAVRFPIGQLYEDIPTTYKAFMKAGQVAFINKPFYKYRMNEASISTTPNPIKPYHIYLGFKAYYECAEKDFPEISEQCCANAAHYAISTYFHYCSEKPKELECTINDILPFIDRHKKVILKNKGIPRSRIMALKLYYTSNLLFKVFCRVFHVIGLQKFMGFEEK